MSELRLECRVISFWKMIVSIVTWLSVGFCICSNGSVRIHMCLSTTSFLIQILFGRINSGSRDGI